MARSRKVRRSSKKEVDRISNLPDELIESILNRVPVADAVRTSGLSRKWRFNWVTRKNLRFDLHFSDKELSPIDHISIVHDVLGQHRGSITSFVLELPNIFSRDIRDLVCLCLEMVSEKGARYVTIKYSWGFDRLDHRVLTPLFSCLELTSLELVECEFQIPPSFRGFPNLVSIKCTSVEFIDNSIQVLISICPLLACLKMKGCTSRRHLNLTYSENLKYLDVKCISNYKVNVSAKNLESLTVHLFTTNPVRFNSTPLCFLTKLVFKLDFSISGHLSSFLRLLGIAPNLQELEILSYSTELSEGDPSTVVVEEPVNNMLDKLLYARIDICFGSDNELWLIKLLLAQSPSLEKMVVVHTLHVPRDPRLYGELIGFPRISPRVQLNYF